MADLRHVNGFAALEQHLKNIGEEMASKAGQSAIRMSAKTVADAVKANAPVSDENDRSPMSKQYGHLKDNIKIKKGKPRKAHSVSSLVTVGSSFWARFLEFGTVKMAARPFFGPAFEGVKDKLVDELAGNLRKSLERIARRRRP